MNLRSRDRSQMLKPNRSTLYQVGTQSMLIIGILLVVASAFYSSSIVAILGLALVFWGFILLYVTPVKHVPLDWLNAAAQAHVANIERVLFDLKSTEKGIYLPPQNLQNIESSLIFVPAKPDTPCPRPKTTLKD